MLQLREINLTLSRNTEIQYIAFDMKVKCYEVFEIGKSRKLLFHQLQELILFILVTYVYKKAK